MLSSSVFPAYVRRLYSAANPVLAHPLYDLYNEGDSSDEEEGTRNGDAGPISPEAKATAAFAAAQSGEQPCGGWEQAAVSTCAVWCNATVARQAAPQQGTLRCQLQM